MSASTSPDNIFYPTSTDSFGPLETAFATMASSVQTALNGTKTYRTADHTSLAAITAMASGALATVIEGGATFGYDGSVWQQKTDAIFASTANRDTAYAKAGGAYRVSPSARVIITGIRQEWNGSAWQSVSAMMSVIPASVGGTTVVSSIAGKVSFTAASGLNLNNCFSTAADKYEIFIDITGMSTVSQVGMYLRASSADNTTANYDWQALYGSASAAGSSGIAAGTQWQLTSAATGSHSIHITLFNPAQATLKRGVVSTTDYTGGAAPTVSTIGLGFRSGTVFDGFSIFALAGGTFAGVISVEAHLN